MEQFSGIDKQIDDAMKQEPVYFLPDTFADEVAGRVFRKMIFRFQVQNFVRILGVSVLMSALFAGMMFAPRIFPQYFPQMPHFKYLHLIVAVAALALFLMFMDKVVLGYLRMRYR